MRYLAIDYGTKCTGLAISDLGQTIVSPLTVIRSQKGLLKKIINSVTAENVDAVVIGLPLNMDGSQGPQARLVIRFAEQLKKHLQIPVLFQDERLSSFAAQQQLIDAGFTKNQMKQRLDAVAAADILETFLENKGG
jgi:putative Holliday junction resolvase